MTTMNSLTSWISPGAIRAVGWALLHFVWQGTALAAFAAGAMAMSRRAAVRYAVGVGALTLMLLAPLATLAFLWQEHSGVADTGKSSPLAAVAWPNARGRAAASGPAETPSTLSVDALALPWLVEAWLLGVTFFSLRSAGGFLLLERERRRQSLVARPWVLELCYGMQDRLRLNRAVEYCECAWLQAPAVIGWFRPVVFLPVTALTGLSEDQLRSVIAHELAHIQRLDPFVNVFQVGVETLLFYHPAVWWLNKKIRAEREHCCDDVAVTACGNAVEYARALALMEQWRSAPALAMAANRSPLTERIVRVLGLKTLGSGIRGIGLTGSALCLTAALIAGNALLGMARPKVAGGTTPQNMPGAETLARAAAKPSAAVAAAQAEAAAESAASAAADEQSSPSSSSPESSSSAPASSYLDSMKAAGLNDLSIDQLIALKIQGVTPEYVREMRALGLNPDAENLIAMKVQDITPEYVKELRDAGLNPDRNQIIGLKVQGADVAYYRELKDAGIQPDVNQLIALKVQGVTPEYVRGLRAAGFTLTADHVIAMKVQDVTPEYVREIQGLGFKPSTHELIALRVQDVTPEYIKALQAAGFKVGISEIIGAKVQDVTPEFIELARKHGFKDLTLQKLIRLRQLGILESKADL